MKKFLALFLAACVLLTMVACSGDQGGNGTTNPPAQTTAPYDATSAPTNATNATNATSIARRTSAERDKGVATVARKVGCACNSGYSAYRRRRCGGPIAA